MTTPELDKKDKRHIMDDLIYEHLHRFGENNLFRASLDSFRETGKASGSFRAALHAMFEQYAKHLQSENARISEEHNKLTDKYLKLSADYADLYERRKTIEQVQTPGK